MARCDLGHLAYFKQIISIGDDTQRLMGKDKVCSLERLRSKWSRLTLEHLPSIRVQETRKYNEKFL